MVIDGWALSRFRRELESAIELADRRHRPGQYSPDSHLPAPSAPDYSRDYSDRAERIDVRLVKKGICTMQDAKRRRSNKVMGALVMLILVISTIGVFTTLPRTVNAFSLQRSSASKQGVMTTGGAGATLPYVEMEAYQASTNGTILGPDYTFGDLASDAVEREAVLLQGQGKYVQFTLPQQANSIDLRYSIPDAAGGGGITAPLSIYINGTKQTDLQLTSQYSWPIYPAILRSQLQFVYFVELVPQMAAGTT